MFRFEPAALAQWFSKVCSAAFGAPVLPEVKTIVASAAGSNGGRRGRAAVRRRESLRSGRAQQIRRVDELDSRHASSRRRVCDQSPAADACKQSGHRGAGMRVLTGAATAPARSSARSRTG